MDGKNRRNSKERRQQKAAEAKNLAGPHPSPQSWTIWNHWKPQPRMMRRRWKAGDGGWGCSHYQAVDRSIWRDAPRPAGRYLSSRPGDSTRQMVPSDNTTANPAETRSGHRLAAPGPIGVCCASIRFLDGFPGRSANRTAVSYFSAPHAPSAPDRSTRAARRMGGVDEPNRRTVITGGGPASWKCRRIGAALAGNKSDGTWHRIAARGRVEPVR